VTDSRESAVSHAFVALASTLANGYDVVDLLDELTGDCARLLDIASAGLLLADDRGVLHVLAASSDITRQLEAFQVQREDGPCLECFRTGSLVAATDLSQAADRWPQFVPAAMAAGFHSVHAVPMRLRESVLGALGLFGTTTGFLNDEDLALGQAFADVASVALVQDRAAADNAAVRDQLQVALTSRIAIEQAKGILSQVGNLEMKQAFDALRGYARSRGLRLSDVAADVVSRTLPAVDVLAPAAKRV
jgi:transcriptional regulator with GAF, ATPase, and Fis domain